MVEIFLTFYLNYQRGSVSRDQTAGTIQPQQRLHISGSHQALEDAVRVLKGELAPPWVLDRIRRESISKQQDIVVVEMTITADSRLINRTLPTSGIADLHGVAVLGIHRPDRLLGERANYSDVGDLRISEGDVLLVMGLPKDLQNFAIGRQLLMLEEHANFPKIEGLSAAIMAASILTASIEYSQSQYRLLLVRF